MLVHKETNQFYFGYQYANKVPSSKSLGKIYFTSSKIISKLGFQNFNYIIIAEFFDPLSAYKFEQLLISENFHNPLILNKSYHTDDNSAFGPVTENTRQNMKNAQLNRYSKNPAKKRSEESKQKSSKSRKRFLQANPGASRLYTRRGIPQSDQAKENISKGVKLGLSTPTAKLNRSLANSGANNPRALTVIFNGVTYACQKDAIAATGVSKYLMNRSPNYKVLPKT